MAWRSRGRRKAARALKGAAGGTGGPTAGAAAPLAGSASPLWRGRSSRGGRGGRGEDDDDRPERVPRPGSSPAPFIIAGGFVLAAIVIVVVIAGGQKGSRRSGGGSSGSDGGYSYSGSGGGSGGAGSSSAAAARPRGGSTDVRIRSVLKGLSRAGDERGWTAACGRCGTRLTSRVPTCPNSSCAAQLRWDTRKRLKCEFCCPRAKLRVKDLNEIPENDRDGFCAFCLGSGMDPDYKAESSYIAFGLTRDGADTGVTPGECSICKRSGKCMKCLGSGWVEMPETFLP